MYDMVKDKKHLSPWQMITNVLLIQVYTFVGLILVIGLFFVLQTLFMLLMTKKIKDESSLAFFKDLMYQIINVKIFVILPLLTTLVVSGYSYYILNWKSLRISDVQVIMWVIGTASIVTMILSHRQEL
jgi:uncharacterized membrane protein